MLQHKSWKHVLGLVALLVVLFAAFNGCTSTPTTPTTTAPTTAAPEKVTIMVPAELTGTVSMFGIAISNGEKLAAEEINASGGITVAGKKYLLDLAVYDTKGTGDDAMAAVTRFIEVNKGKLIVGMVASASVAPVCEYLKGHVNDAVFIIPGTVYKGTRDVGNVFRMLPTADTVCAGMTIYIANNTSWKNVGHVVDSMHSGHFPATTAMNKDLQGHGINVLTTETYKMGQTDFLGMVGKIKASKPDAVIDRGFIPEQLTMMKQAWEAGLKVPWIGTNDIPVDTAMKALTPEMIAGSVEVGPGVSLQNLAQLGNKTAADVLAKYKQRFNNEEPGYLVTNGYDSIRILAHALEAAGTVTDVPKIIDALLKLQVTPDLANSLVPYQGNLLFNSTRELNEKIFSNKWLANGQKQLAGLIEVPASAMSIY